MYAIDRPDPLDIHTCMIVSVYVSVFTTVCVRHNVRACVGMPRVYMCVCGCLHVVLTHVLTRVVR